MHETRHETEARLMERLVYGSYPELIQKKSLLEKKEYLKEIVDAYLLKDILELDGVRRSEKMVRLLQLVAFQIGKEVSLAELGRQLEMGKNTVERYLDLLEKSFVIFRVPGFSRNLRKEISKSSRYYFYDIGIRNALINNFNAIELRDDVGELWENYIIAERIKKQEYDRILSNNYFWRTYEKQEIDWVEERDGKLYGYEIKWNPKKTPHAPKAWTDTYANAEYSVITRENYLDFIS